MSRTIGRHWPHARGDYVEQCDFCGVPWPRSQLRVDGSGLYVCPDEGDGDDAVTLSDDNAAMTPNPAVEDGGRRRP